MRFGGTEVELLQRLMSAASLRSRVMAGNLANQNTPGYVRRTVSFEDALARSLAGGRVDRDQLLALTPEVRLDRLTPGRPDGNNVNMELELHALRENQLRYEAYAAIVQTRGSILRASITGNPQ